MRISIWKTVCSVALVLSLAFIVSPPLSGAESETEPESGEAIVPILMYHEVKPYKTRKDVITPGELQSDLQFLAREHYHTIVMKDLIAYTQGKEKLPSKPIVLSFDDGYYNNYRYVYPLLKRYQMRIVLSIIGKDTDAFSTIPDENIDYAHVTWAEIREMQQSGLVEIQNHTYNLHQITAKRFGCSRAKGESVSAYEQVLTDDLQKLQKEIAEQTGRTPDTFTYPYGTVCEESVPIIRKLGFQASLTCSYGINVLPQDPNALFGLKRVCRVHGVSLQKTLKEAMKTLKYR